MPQYDMHSLHASFSSLNVAGIMIIPSDYSTAGSGYRGESIYKKKSEYEEPKKEEKHRNYL